jgi:hypothetical protein
MLSVLEVESLSRAMWVVGLLATFISMSFKEGDKRALLIGALVLLPTSNAIIGRWLIVSVDVALVCYFLFESKVHEFFKKKGR